MLRQYDYIIVGAGVIGCATAYYLQKNNLNARILLIDQNTQVGLGNTAKSAALYRTLFSSSINYQLTVSSVAYYQTIASQIHLQAIQYLWLFSKQQWNHYQVQKFPSHKDNNHRILNEKDLEKIISISPSVTFPAQYIYKGIFCPNCGSLSAVGLTNHYAQQFQRLGGIIHLNTKIQKLHLSGEETAYAPWDNIHLDTLNDNENRCYKAKEYIFAVGAWTFSLLTPIGLYTGSLPKKRQLFGIRYPQSFSLYKKNNINPALILPTAGIYIKPIPKRNMLLIGCADNLGQPYSMENPTSDESFYLRAIQPVIAQYFPKLKSIRPQLKWAGYYSYHLPDKHPVIEKVANLTWVCGTSGSGIMKADALGRITAARAANQSSVDLMNNLKFQINRLSLNRRAVPIEQLII